MFLLIIIIIPANENCYADTEIITQSIIGVPFLNNRKCAGLCWISTALKMSKDEDHQGDRISSSKL